MLGYRYLTRIPDGENVGAAFFPAPDNYMQLVRQTGGGIFSLKAFVGKNSKAKKAIPRTMKMAIGRQVREILSACKECSCHGCRIVERERCFQ